MKKYNEIVNDNNETKLLFRPLWRNGRKRFKTLNAIDVVCANKYCIAEGSPGSGKSTMIRHITSSLVHHYRDVNGDCLLSNDTRSTLFNDNRFLPLYMNIKNICDLDGDNINLSNVLEKIGGLKESGIKASDLKDFIINNNIVYLIDCDNEIIDNAKLDEIRTFIKSIRVANGGKNKNRLVIVCGTDKMQASDASDFFRFKFQSMTSECREQLVDKIFESDKSRSQKFKRVLAGGCIDEAIIGNPRLFSFLLYTYKKENKILSSKSCVARECIKFLLNSCQKNSKELVDKLLKDGDLNIVNRGLLQQIYGYVTNSMQMRFMNILQTLAYETVFESKIGVETIFSHGKIVDIINAVDAVNTVDKNNLGDYEYAAINQSGILSSLVVGNEVKHKFAYDYFQEYLSAVRLAEQGDNICNIIKDKLCDLDDKFKNVILMLVEIWYDENPGTWMCLVWWLLEFFVYYIQTNKITAEIKYYIASLCANVISCRDYFVVKNIAEIVNDTILDILYKCNDFLMNVLNENEADFKIKNECAQCLWNIGRYIPNDLKYDESKVGDCRRGVGVYKNEPSEPDIVWCSIKGGVFTLGYEGDSDDSDYLRELPSVDSVVIKDFYMSKYPITMDQYRLFVDDGAYKNSEFWKWSGVASKWFDDFMKRHDGCDKINEYIDALFDNVGNAPMVNITWIEAKTYCVWLSHKMNAEIRLPYETEWEYVAKLLGNNLYAFSDVYDNRYYIGRDVGLKKAAPVGLTKFPTNIISEKFDEYPRDLNGNVWEWTQTIMSKDETLRNYIKNRKKVELTSDGYNKFLKDDIMMVVRGGSYLNGALQLRNTYRGRDQIFAHILFRQGFRIVKECAVIKECCDD